MEALICDAVTSFRGPSGRHPLPVDVLGRRDTERLAEGDNGAALTALGIRLLEARPF